MPRPPYKRPPITEAVIEIRFVQPVKVDREHSIIKKFRSEYGDCQEFTSYDVKFDITGSNITQDTTPHLGFRFSSADMTELVILSESSFAVSQLAPYPGWEKFIARLVRDWRTWQRAMGFRDVQRIGVRYINRIDLPIEGPLLNYADYLNVYPHFPNTLGPTSAYAVQAHIPLPEMKCTLSLNTAIVQSPLPDFLSIVFDQDIGRDVQPPQYEEEIVQLLQEIHDKKNEVFEESITTKAREIFNRE